MEKNFKHTAPAEVEPIVIEQVFAEKRGGGMIANSAYDIATGTAVGMDNGKLKPIKCYKLTKAVTAEATTIEIAKGSGIAVGDIIGTGKKAVACTGLDTTSANVDVVTVTLGGAVASGVKLYQAKAVHATQAVPIYTPLYVTGAKVYAGQGDCEVRLINGVNLRKETAPIAEEVAALLPTINLV